MKTTIEVTIDPKKMSGVYEGRPGYVSTYDHDGNLIKRREATEQEALQEHWVQRIEQAMLAAAPEPDLEQS